MLIKSQDKKTVFNMDNLINIGVRECSGGVFKNPYEIYVIDKNGKQHSIAVYKTMKTAERIVEEVTISYSNIEMVKIPQITIQETITSKMLLRAICYEMPEE